MSNFEEFIKDIETNRWKVHGVELYKEGSLVNSWGNTTSKFPIYSATKTILSIAMGIAKDRNLLDFEKSVLDYMPGNAVEKMTENNKSVFSKISLHRLMTMSVEGFPFRPSGNNYLDFSLSRSIANPEKAEFHYSNIPAFLCGVALTSAINEDAGEFIKREILMPLSIQDVKIGYTDDGYFYGASNMEMSVNDLSKIGILLYNNGEYDGQQIVSPDYIKKATSILQMNKEGGYGYFIWKYRNGFSINGKWKQKCYVLPEDKLIITHLADIQQDCGLKESMEKWLINKEQ